jgi:hypothetical protein
MEARVLRAVNAAIEGHRLAEIAGGIGCAALDAAGDASRAPRCAPR